MDAALFRRHTDVPSENPGPATDPERSGGREDEGVLSLVTFFARAKKVTRAAARKPLMLTLTFAFALALTSTAIWTQTAKTLDPCLRRDDERG
jgi:hypothetical protein